MRLKGPALCFFAIFFLAIPGMALQITEFCPDPYLPEDPDEYIVLSGMGSLEGISLSDGEGGFRFPAGSSISGKITIAKNAVKFYDTHGRYPDYEWYNYSPDVPDVIRSGNFALANSRDEINLYENNQLIQVVTWPGNVTPREGQIHFLSDGIWDPRPLFIGQSRFSPVVFENVTVTTFVSPDSSYEVLTGAIASARQEIHLNVYELSSPGITDALVSANERGISVVILLEGGPVGGISREEKASIYRLNSSGIPVQLMQSTDSAHAPYRYDHAKYVVIDTNSVLVTSENFGSTGIPAPGTKGNRGWGVFIQDPRVAQYMDTVFVTDAGSRYISSSTGIDGELENPGKESYSQKFPSQSFSGARVSPVIAPDTSYQILDLINSAKSTIYIEQAYITNESPSKLNPYLSAAINASRHGVHVRVLLDSYWYNLEDSADNDEMVRLINRIADEENLPLEARLVNTDNVGFEKIHNKGVIVDGERVLVSSINWNSNSPNFNREAGIIIEHPGIGNYFSEVFQYDWDSGKAQAGKTDYLKIGIAVLILVVLAGFAIYRYQRK